MSSEVVNLTTLRLYMGEGGVLELARVWVFPSRSTHGTFAAPPVGDIYETEQIFL